jgi:hypothetical protein
VVPRYLDIVKEAVHDLITSVDSLLTSLSKYGLSKVVPLQAVNDCSKTPNCGTPSCPKIAIPQNPSHQSARFRQEGKYFWNIPSGSPGPVTGTCELLRSTETKGPTWLSNNSGTRWNMLSPQRHSLIKERLTLRMPESWRNRVTDRKLSKWLNSLPDSLAADSGGGLFRCSFALTWEEFSRLKHQSSLLGMQSSTLVRRLIATHIEGFKSAADRQRPSAPPKVTATAKRPSGEHANTSAVSHLSGIPSERECKEAFKTYVSDLERVARSGLPESGEAQMRLARIREAPIINY